MEAFKAPTTYSPANQYPSSDSVCRLANKAARLITINLMDDQSGEQFCIKVLPGQNEPSNAPAQAMDQAFVKNLLSTGDLITLPLEG